MTGFLKPFHSFTQSHVDTKLIIAYFFYCVQRSKIGGMCMSEPNAGTDVLGMKSNAVYDPTRGGYILNGTKMWITNGTLTGKETGDLFLVYARTGTENRNQITQFVVEGGMDGFSVGQKINDKLGMRGECSKCDNILTKILITFNRGNTFLPMQRLRRQKWSFKTYSYLRVHMLWVMLMVRLFV